mgnify:CR=1 FL=1
MGENMNKNILDLKNLKALLLDLDGTLINSEKAFFESFKNVLQDHFNISITKEDYKKYELEQNAMLLKKLRETNLNIKNISDKEIMSLIYNDYESEFRKIILEEEAIDNFNILKELKKLKLTLALVTTCRRHYLNILIEELGLEKLFDIIVAREDVENLKPAPDAYLDAIKALDIDKDTSLALIDTSSPIFFASAPNLSIVLASLSLSNLNFDFLSFLDIFHQKLDYSML